MGIGANIQLARKRAGLTQNELGEKMGVSGSMIGQWENDLRSPKAETLLKIADALDISILDIFPSRNDIISKLVYQEGFEESQDELRECGYSFSDEEMKLIESFSELNLSGQKVAIERVKELTEISKYKVADSAETEPPPDGVEMPSDGNA